MGEMREIKLSEIRPGPVRHDGLPPELLEPIKDTYDTVGRYVQNTLEEWELGFMRDMHPEREVAVWCFIASVWRAYHKEHLNGETLSDDEERSLIGALTAISTGVLDARQLKVDPEVGRGLLKCWQDTRKRLRRKR
ncbi:MAG TPA: hypothetical protein VHC22_17925 [Pirellulales bacterium]|nr:hypothetical protein [Pirellulales bacterium]